MAESIERLNARIEVLEETLEEVLSEFVQPGIEPTQEQIAVVEKIGMLLGLVGGSPPVPSLTWQPPGFINGHPVSGRWVFSCTECGGAQGYAPPDKSGGITESEAELLGWRKLDGEWLCPICSGNDGNLRKVFERNKGKCQAVYGNCDGCGQIVDSNTPGLAMRQVIHYRCGECAPLTGNDSDEE